MNFTVAVRNSLLRDLSLVIEFQQLMQKLLIQFTLIGKILLLVIFRFNLAYRRYAYADNERT